MDVPILFTASGGGYILVSSFSDVAPLFFLTHLKPTQAVEGGEPLIPVAWGLD